MKHQPQPGARVRATGDYLRNTGQERRPEGSARRAVVKCECDLCGRGDHVAIDERSVISEGQRHFHIANLEQIGGAL